MTVWFKVGCQVTPASVFVNIRQQEVAIIAPPRDAQLDEVYTHIYEYTVCVCTYIFYFIFLFIQATSSGAGWIQTIIIIIMIMAASIRIITTIVHFTHALVQSNLQYIHTYTEGDGCYARCQPAHQEQFGVQYLAQRHADQGSRTSDLLITIH